MSTPVLNVENLSVYFDTPRGTLHAIRDLSFSLNAGETLGIVGESGSGKSVTSLALMDLLANNAHVEAERMQLLQHDLRKLSERQKQSLRGSEMAMIFQDPMSSLNPCFSVGFQLMETLKIHQPELTKQARENKAIELLQQVGIPSAQTRLDAYPHQLSGGMCQRVMIAIAIACQPKLLIADEPTTALDVTIQAQILNLLLDIQKQAHMAMILITHDIGVVAEHTQQTMVMYAGEVVEYGSTDAVIHHPQHPYTQALLRALPSSHDETAHRSPLPSIDGLVPDLVHRPSGCQLHPRCQYAQAQCSQQLPALEQVATGKVRCFFPLQGTSTVSA